MHSDIGYTVTRRCEDADLCRNQDELRSGIWRRLAVGMESFLRFCAGPVRGSIQRSSNTHHFVRRRRHTEYGRSVTDRYHWGLRYFMLDRGIHRGWRLRITLIRPEFPGSRRSYRTASPCPYLYETRHTAGDQHHSPVVALEAESVEVARGTIYANHCHGIRCRQRSAYVHVDVPADESPDRAKGYVSTRRFVRR